MGRANVAVAMVLGCALWTACAPATTTPSATAPADPAGASQASTGIEVEPTAPRTCLSSADCGEAVCEGQGCGDATPGHCVPAVRACTKDLATYCGCDGRTFRTSGSCPGRRFAHRGPCEGERAVEP